MRKVISTDSAPAAVGPYSQGIRVGDWLWVSGQIPLDPATGVIVEGGIAEQTARALENLAAVLAAGGATLDDVVRTTVYLTDLGDFQAMNEVYAGVFGGDPPARACVEVCRLPKDADVEIDGVAFVGGTGVS